jgi:NAD(P)-dependent dehydrogenase (short-subunit alcohol dehydrogenase family)
VGSHTGRIAVVTGAGRGIGQEYAVALATDGATVVVADLDDDLAAETVKLIERAGGTAVARHLDVSDQSSAAEFDAACLRRRPGCLRFTGFCRHRRESPRR